MTLPVEDTTATPRTSVRGERHSGAAPALEMQGVSKAFDGRPALIDASFSLAWGEVHALVGENGAGKSTLMNVATGVYAADSGTEIVDGEAVVIRGPGDATAAGLGMVHQHFRLVGRFSVAENVLLALGRGSHVRSVAEAADLVAAKAAEVGLGVRPDAMVANLSVAERQRAEILKVLVLGARIVILDEPTAVLTESEADALLAFTRRLADQGHAVVLITHKLREVAARSDRVTVMRQGRTVLAGAPTAGLDIGEVARLAVGSSLGGSERPNSTPGRERLRLAALSMARSDGTTALDGLSLDLRAGEVLGIAGVGGNGQQELVECLAGLARPAAGTMTLDGRDVGPLSIRARRRLGLRIIPSDRFDTGLVGAMTVAENLALTGVAEGRFGGPFFLSRARMRSAAQRAIAAFDIHGAAPGRVTSLLSGGNAQKVLLARELDEGLTVLVAHSPARGLDVKATRAVHDLVKAAVEAGAACLLISEDLEEVLSLSHRVAVMNRGRIAGEMPIENATTERIGALMIGHA